jgi:hypothetical protein
LAGYGAITMAEALEQTITTLPQELRRSLNGDRGKELSAHARCSIASGVKVYFADAKSPWQRGAMRTHATTRRQHLLQNLANSCKNPRSHPEILAHWSTRTNANNWAVYDRYLKMFVGQCFSPVAGDAAIDSCIFPGGEGGGVPACVSVPPVGVRERTGVRPLASQARSRRALFGCSIHRTEIL